MTGTLALLLAIQSASSGAIAPPVVPTAPPADWSHLPDLPWRVAPDVTPDLAGFVAAEVRGGRCSPAPGPLSIDLAVAIRPDGSVRAVVPRAIDCPTVEQFAAGLASRFTRGNLRSAAAGWYRTSLSFDWDR